MFILNLDGLLCQNASGTVQISFTGDPPGSKLKIASLEINGITYVASYSIMEIDHELFDFELTIWYGETDSLQFEFSTIDDIRGAFNSM
jgi:hypothetical protein